MVEILKAKTDDQVLDIIKWSVAEDKPLEVRGRGSKTALGRPIEMEQILDLSGLTGVNFYEPAELVLSAGAATPVFEVQKLLADHNQHMAFEPPDLGPLLGQDQRKGSLGGLLACNLAGSRRLKVGSARDHFLGFTAVSGRGEVFKSGGRVVKNVTGFDLSKLMAGSYGTLAVLTEVIVKVLPEPEKIRTILLIWKKQGTHDHDAVKAMTQALSSPHEVSGVAHLPRSIAERSAVDYLAGGDRAVTAIRVEGPGPSVTHRCMALRSLLASFGDTEELHTQNSKGLWREIRNVLYFSDDERLVWRISVPPSAGSKVVSEILEARAGEAFYDWGGGLIWLALHSASGAGADMVRHCVGAVSGHATLVRAPDSMRRSVSVFEPQMGPLKEINRRIKEGFDPKGILNPGRIQEDY